MSRTTARSAKPSVKETTQPHSTEAAAIRLQMVSVIFVGVLALLLTAGAIAITLVAPSQSERVWPIIVPLLTTAIGSLIWWSARARR